MKRLLLLATAIFLSTAQLLAAEHSNCRGRVVDEQGEPVIGATITIPGTKIGTVTNIDGFFQIEVPQGSKDVEIRYVGYKTVLKKSQGNLGEVRLEAASQMLRDVVVTQSIAKTRETPVAISEVSARVIDMKLGNQEFPEVLKTTPGVWATKDGGGYGDSKINMRGFQAANVAVMINGVPVNDMEWGGVYWSNWAGLSDVTSSMRHSAVLARRLCRLLLSAEQSTSSPNRSTPRKAAPYGTAWATTDCTRKAYRSRQA